MKIQLKAPTLTHLKNLHQIRRSNHSYSLKISKLKQKVTNNQPKNKKPKKQNARKPNENRRKPSAS